MYQNKAFLRRSMCYLFIQPLFCSSYMPFLKDTIQEKGFEFLTPH